MARVVLVGNVKEYQSKFNFIDREIIKGNISIVSALFNDDISYNVLDGFDIVKSLDALETNDFDYFILLNENKEFYFEAPIFGFHQNIIPGNVFEIPNFDFKKYEQLVKNPPSIISRHCWGGLLLNQLGLKFNTPFINLFLFDEDFNKLARNFDYYINQELQFEKEEYEHILKRNYPVGRLDDVLIYFNHYTSFQEAKRKWDERKERINFDNLFFETTTEDINLALEFDSLPLDHKLCFFWGHIDSPDVIDFSEFLVGRPRGSLGMLVNHTGNGMIPYFDPIELLLNFDYSSRIEFKK